MIAIKTMNEMPRNCLECPAFDNCEDCEGYMNACGITNEYVGYIHDEPKIMIDKRPDSCPLTADVRENVQLDVCPLYGGVCGYPSGECYDCPRHGNFRKNVSGEWIKIHWKAFRCSECKGISEYYTDFCPNCGARMDGEDGDHHDNNH